MSDMLGILDEYFVPMVNGETEQEKYITAYGLMVSFLYDLEEIRCDRGIKDSTKDTIDYLDNFFDESMMEQFGYIFELENSSEVEETEETIIFDNAEDTVEYILKYSDIYKSNGIKLTYEDILSQIEDLYPNEYGADFGNIFVHKVTNW